MNLLLLSSSRAGDSDYLAPALPLIGEQMQQIHELLFIPFADVSRDYDAYVAKVQTALEPLGIQVNGLHQYADYQEAIALAPAIAVGGGNTFQLLDLLYRNQCLELIADRVKAGTPYLGWSAGSNIAGLSIKTTNDMPIIQPPSFAALGLIPCQINPHYSDFKPAGFHGETRDMRLAEFMQVEPQTPVLALPEGSAIRQHQQQLYYVGNSDGYLFMGGAKVAILPGADLTAFLGDAS